MAKNEDVSAEMMLQSVRLSFPDLWVPSTGPDPKNPSKPTFGGHFIIEQPEQVASVKRVIGMLAKQAWGDNSEAVLQQLAATNNKLALKNGNTKTDSAGNLLEGYAGHWFVSARNQKRPTTVNRDRTPVSAEDGVIYSGCYVNAKVRFWVQKGGQYGKAINCQLLGVQFVKDGEAFSGAGRVASPDDFESLEEFAASADALIGSDDLIGSGDPAARASGW